MFAIFVAVFRFKTMSQLMKHLMKSTVAQTYIQCLPLKVHYYSNLIVTISNIYYILIFLQNVQARHLNLLECHSKDLLNQHGVSVQKFKIVENADETSDVLKSFGM